MKVEVLWFYRNHIPRQTTT